MTQLNTDSGKKLTDFSSPQSDRLIEKAMDIALTSSGIPMGATFSNSLASLFNDNVRAGVTAVGAKQAAKGVLAIAAAASQTPNLIVKNLADDIKREISKVIKTPAAQEIGHNIAGTLMFSMSVASELIVNHGSNAAMFTAEYCAGIIDKSENPVVAAMRDEFRVNAAGAMFGLVGSVAMRGILAYQNKPATVTGANNNDFMLAHKHVGQLLNVVGQTHPRLAMVGQGGWAFVEAYKLYKSMDTITKWGAVSLTAQIATAVWLIGNAIFGGSQGDSIETFAKQLLERIEQYHQEIMQEFAEIKEMLGKIYEKLLDIQANLSQLSQLAKNAFDHIEKELRDQRGELHQLIGSVNEFIAFERVKTTIISNFRAAPKIVSELDVMDALKAFYVWGDGHSVKLNSLTGDKIAAYDSTTVVRTLTQTHKTDANVGYLQNYLTRRYGANNHSVCNPIALADAVESYAQIAGYYTELHKKPGLPTLAIFNSNNQALLSGHMEHLYKTAVNYYAWQRDLQLHKTLFDDLIKEYQQAVLSLKNHLFQNPARLRDLLDSIVSKDKTLIAMLENIDAAYHLCRRFIEATFPTSFKMDPQLIIFFTPKVGMLHDRSQIEERLKNLAQEHPKPNDTPLSTACYYYFEDQTTTTDRLKKVIASKQSNMRANSSVRECHEYITSAAHVLIPFSRDILGVDLGTKFDLKEKGKDFIPSSSPYLVNHDDFIADVSVADLHQLIATSQHQTLAEMLKKEWGNISAAEAKAALFYATYLNNFRAVRLLLTTFKQLTITDQDALGNNLLHVAAASASYFVVPFLIDTGIHHRDLNTNKQQARDLVPSKDKSLLIECVRMVEHKQLEKIKQMLDAEDKDECDLALQYLSELLIGNGCGGVQQQLPEVWKTLIQKLHRNMQYIMAGRDADTPTLSKRTAWLEKQDFELTLKQSNYTVDGNALIYRESHRPNFLLARDLDTLELLNGFAPNGIEIKSAGQQERLMIKGDFFLDVFRQSHGGHPATWTVNVVKIDLRSGTRSDSTFKTTGLPRGDTPIYDLWQDDKFIYCQEQISNRTITIYDLSKQTEITTMMIPKDGRNQIMWAKVTGDLLLLDHCHGDGTRLLDVISLVSKNITHSIIHPYTLDLDMVLDTDKHLLYTPSNKDNNSVIHAWNYITDKVEKIFPLGKGHIPARCAPPIFLHPELNQMLVYHAKIDATQGTVQRWDTDKATLLQEVTINMRLYGGHHFSVKNFLFNGTICRFQDIRGNQLQGELYYDAVTGQPLAGFPQHHRLTRGFGNKLVIGTPLANGQDHAFHVWHLTMPQLEETEKSTFEIVEAKPTGEDIATPTQAIPDTAGTLADTPPTEAPLPPLRYLFHRTSFGVNITRIERFSAVIFDNPIALLRKQLNEKFRHYQFETKKNEGKLLIECLSTQAADSNDATQTKFLRFIGKLNEALLSSGLQSEAFQIEQADAHQLIIKAKPEVIKHINDVLYELSNPLWAPIGQTSSQFFRPSDVPALTAGTEGAPSTHICLVQ